MKFLDLSLTDPGENLALDEALLLECEATNHEGVLRFWESPVPFVVMGIGNHSAVEVDLDACQQFGVPALRRTSGGGAVVQGPGCLNFALILPTGLDPALEGIHSTNDFVLGKMAAALSDLSGCKVEVRGTSDLVVGDLKFSGNAQRRKRGWVLYHGTLLIDFDLSLISTLLRMPSREPDYRAGRSHSDFLINLSASRDAVKRVIADAWSATEPLDEAPIHRVPGLMEKQFKSASWNFKF